MKLSLLVVDNDPLVLDGYKMALADEPVNLIEAKSGKEAMKLIHAKANDFDLVLLDYELGDTTGDKLTEKIKSITPDLPVIIITGKLEKLARSEDVSTDSIRESCLIAGADQVLAKGGGFEQLLLLIQSKFSEKEVSGTTEQQRKQFINETLSTPKNPVIGSSQALYSVADQVKRAAATNFSILITGESGTGKEGIARAIHHLSTRKGQLFQAINCAAIPENLIESELFGSERGAFTGAVKKAGKFLQAHGGTIFLDEIGELKPSLQAKILRAIQEKRVEPVGGSESRKIDIRIIAATHKDIKATIANEGMNNETFRGDLYYRLAEMTIHLPPLRERPEDIEPIANFFIERINKEMNSNKIFSKMSLQKLKAYPWPGNVRELSNIIKGAWTYAKDSQTIRPHNIEEAIGESIDSHPEELLKIHDLISYKQFSDIQIAAEKMYLERALKVSQYNITHAATLLNMGHKSKLDYRIKKTGIQIPNKPTEKSTTKTQREI